MGLRMDARGSFFVQKALRIKPCRSRRVSAQVGAAKRPKNEENRETQGPCPDLRWSCIKPLTVQSSETKGTTRKTEKYIHASKPYVFIGFVTIHAQNPMF